MVASRQSPRKLATVGSDAGAGRVRGNSRNSSRFLKLHSDDEAEPRLEVRSQSEPGSELPGAQSAKEKNPRRRENRRRGSIICAMQKMSKRLDRLVMERCSEERSVQNEIAVDLHVGKFVRRRKEVGDLVVG